MARNEKERDRSVVSDVPLGAKGIARGATLRKFAINERSSALVPRVIRATIIESARAAGACDY